MDVAPPLPEEDVAESAQNEWWQSAVVYQIYPWSFMDSNGDGIGDLAGIRARLDYLTWLGVDAIWISPIYPSPMADFGYDISNYCDVDPRFGTLADFDALIAEAHRQGLKVILDYVPNHTSDQHPWFRAARSSRSDPLRDYYIWRDPAPDGGPPNNWLSEFGGSAWQWDEATGQYYYHAYLKQQPDLNVRNPAVEQALHDVLVFWLERGVDGFRIDAIHHLIKDDEFRDNPKNPNFTQGMPPHRALIREFTTDRPEVHALVARMRRVVDRYSDRVLIGEAWLPTNRLVMYYGIGLSGVHLPFNFQLISAKWEARVLDAIIREYEAALPAGAWPNWVLGNHDRSRIATRVGDAQARVAAMLLLTLRGTPTLYYGDELGMRDGVIPPDRVRDPWERNVPGLGLGRDPERTPMQWTTGEGAGFTSGTPWLPITDEVGTRNVAAQREDPASMLSLYRALLRLRRAEPALSRGDYLGLELHPAVLSFQRRHGRKTFTILLNFTSQPRLLNLARKLGECTLVLSTDPSRQTSRVDGEFELSANLGVVLEHEES
jgi:alpha-glucosidase